jgi:uncharacterized protein
MIARLPDAAVRGSNRRILYASDLHGNQTHYRLLLQLAEEERPDILILGGDNAPKSKDKRSPQLQFRFFEKAVSSMIAGFRRRERPDFKTKIYMIFGNDDFRSYADDLKQLFSSYDVNVLWNDVVKVDEYYDLLAYSFVPLTPFKYKDWEKLDSYNDVRDNVKTDGLVSFHNELRPASYNEIISRGTIRNDLDTLFGQTRKALIFVCHAPPANTDLDTTYTNEHVGSVAVKTSIEKYQPIISLHGHIHEAFEKSHRFCQRIGPTTVAINPGHHFNRSDLHAISIELPSQAIKRISFDGQTKKSIGLSFLQLFASFL